MNLIIIGGERLRTMKSALMLLMLIFLASLAAASGSGKPVSLDVIGSDADNARIVSPGGGPIEVEIIGSTATNIQVGPSEDNTSCTGLCCNTCYCGECSCGYTTIWDDFTRPLCYPWSSYIPTRYNKQFHINSNGYNGNTTTYEYNGYPVAYLGRYYQEFS